MPGYHFRGIADREVDYLNLPRERHLSPAAILRQRPSYIYPENRFPGGHQVAQKAEFRYIGWQICQNCSQIAQIQSETGLKMIANGRFWMEDQLRGHTIDLQTRKNRVSGISLPAGKIRDGCHPINGEALDVLHDPPGYSQRRRHMSSQPENRCLKGHQVAQNGEFRYIDLGIRDYRGRISLNKPEMGSKMIANGRFPAGDRLLGRAVDRMEGRNPRFSWGLVGCQEGRIMETDREQEGMSCQRS
ncbi:MAG: hypothetical protein A4E35_01031 [Methanoregula sp. PtaU1.Bin051]|nr:MAG: hypothetical protein A4E35_01031 [Methanoregula sp. PtaU1.Bin051]